MLYSLRLQQIGKQHPTTIGISVPTTRNVKNKYQDKYKTRINLEIIESWFVLDLHALGLSKGEIDNINSCMASVGLQICPREIIKRERLFTKEMQRLLDYSLSEIGIEERIVNALEEKQNIIKISDFLKHTWDEVLSWGDPKSANHISNFNHASIKVLILVLKNTVSSGMQILFG